MMGRMRAAAFAWLDRLASRSSSSNYTPVRGEWAIVALVVVAGAVLRFLGLRFGLPYFHHWDEQNITVNVHDMIVHGDNVPKFYVYGQPMESLVVLVYQAAQKHHVGGFATAVLDDDIYPRIAGRIIGATLASSGTLAMYLAGRFATRRPAAAIAAAMLYATSCDLVQHARYCVTDASMTALTAWVLCFCAAYALRPTIANGFMACLFCGAAASYKLPGFASLALVVPTLCLRPAYGWIRKANAPPGPALRIVHAALPALAIPVAIVLFLRLNPHVVDHWRDAFHDYEWIANKSHDPGPKPYCYRDPGLRYLGAALWYVFIQSYSPSAALAAIVFGVPAIIGAAQGVRSANTVVVVGLVHAAGVLTPFVSYSAYFVRYFLPTLPWVCLVGGLGVCWIYEALARRATARLKPRARMGVLVLAGLAYLGLAAVPAAYRSVMAQILVKDPRIAALDDVAAIAASEHSPVTLAIAATVAVHESSMGSFRDMHKFMQRPDVKVLGDVRSADDVRKLGARFLINASYRDWGKVEPYTFPWEDQWMFEDVPGYRVVRRYRNNPYVERLDIQADWNGRVQAVLLEKVP
jgi:hypothetical protein